MEDAVGKEADKVDKVGKDVEPEEEDASTSVPTPAAGYNRATDDEIVVIRSLLGRLQAEVCAQKRDGIKDVEVKLSNEEIEFLGHLFGRGLIRAPSSYVPISKYVRPQDMTTDKITKLIQSLKGESQWPINVCFTNLRYTVKVSKSKGSLNTVGTQFQKLFIQPVKNLLRGCTSNKEELVILKDISGVFKAGTTTLVLGPPGSGTTTFFKVLAGVLQGSSGEILYSGFDRSQLRVSSLSNYIDQIDNHLPTLTVRETLEFAFKCFGRSKKLYGQQLEKIHKPEEGADPEEIEKIMSEFPDYLINQFGLQKCADTIVGNALLRGVSGGERKRVTTTEMIMARHPLILCDQISTGLDSAATFDITQSMCKTAQALNLTRVVSLLQPPPEVFELFDEVMVIAEGMTLYHGKRENVLPFFESIGFKCPREKDIADFVQEVATRERSIYQIQEDAPDSNEKIAALWKESEFSLEKRQQIDHFSSRDRATEYARVQEIFGKASPLFSNSLKADIGLVFERQKTLFLRNKGFIVVRICQSLLIGVIVGTVFLNLSSELNAPNVAQRYGLVFNMCLQSMLSGMAAVPGVIGERAVYYKHSKNNFYRTISYVLSSSLVAMPLQILETFVNVTTCFWLSAIVPRDADDAVGRYFLVFLILATLNVSFGNYLRFVGAFSPSRGVGQVLAGVSISFLILTSGFTVTVNLLPDYFIWIYWINPLAWTIRACMLVIFNSEAFVDSREFALDLFALQTENVFIWTGFLLVFFYIFFNLNLQTLALKYIRYESFGGTKIKAAEESENTNTKTEFNSLALTRTESNLLTVDKVNLVFRNISYSVSAKGQQVDLLNGVSGYAKAGTMTALMGSSGAGKTTLMDVIAGRKTSGNITGEIFINGRLKDKKTFAHLAAYVEQMDIHSPHATVEEALKFSAFLRQAESVTKEQKLQFIEQVIDALELNQLRELEIGFKETGGLSTEQVKRVTIGVELAANPSVIFLDEPTSGLDSRAAEIVMRGIKRIAMSGRTVLCTIHQPNRQIFESFDRLLLLQRGGRVVYFGDIGKSSSSLLGYFSAIPGTKSIQNERYNPATYMLEVIGAGTTSSALVDYAYEYSVNAQFNSNLEAIDQLIESDLKNMQPIRHKKEFLAGYTTQQLQLLLKFFRTYWRSPSYNLLRYIVLAFMAFLWGFAFFQAGKGDFNETTEVQSIVGIMFMALIFIGIINMNTTIPQVITERAPYYRERAAKMYAAFPYAIAVSLAELPYLITSTLLFMVIYYSLIGLHDAPAKMFLFWFIFFLYIAFATFYGQMLAVLLPNQQIATIVAGFSSSMLSLFCGYMIGLNHVSEFWKFMTYIAPTRYGLNALVAIQLACPCEFELSADQELTLVDDSCNTDGFIGCNVVSLDGGQQMTAWRYIQNIYGFTDDVYNDMGALIGFIIGIRTITGFGYAYVNHLKR